MSSPEFDRTLAELRDNIDAIDEQIISLIERRCEIVKAVGRLKDGEVSDRCYIRPAREAIMLKKIASDFKDSDFPIEAATTIWRTIISASTAMESPLSLAVKCSDGSLVPYFIAREYFGSFLPTAIYHHSAQLVAAVEDDNHTVGIINLKDNAELAAWWLQLALSPKNINIFTCIPFVQKLSSADIASNNPFVAIAQLEAEETGDDISYIVLQFDGSHPLDNVTGLIGEWLKSGDFRGSLIDSVKTSDNHWAAFIKLKGFANSHSELFIELKQHILQISDGALYDIHFVGAHATPILIDN